MEIKDKGQSAGTPAGDQKPTGQENIITPPGDEDLIGDVVRLAKADEDKKAADLKAGKEAKPGEKDDKGEKPAPYDQDPKWKAARAAQAKFESILEKHGLESADELEELLAGGMSISEILGARDAKTLTQTIQQLKKDADYLKEVKAYWAEQDRKKKLDELTPEQRAEMSEKELADYKKQQAQAKAKNEEEASIKIALDNYSEQVDKVVESLGFEGESAEVAKLFMGVNNPFNEVDITDKKAVKAMAKESATKFKTFVDKIRQGAVDEYARGKSKIVPITKAESPGNPVVTPKPIPKDATVDQVFSQAQDEMLEIIRQMSSAG